MSRLLAIGFSFALLASGCGGGSTESQATATTASTTTTTSVSGCVDVPPVAGRRNGGAKPPTARLDAAKTYLLTFVTNCGAFTVTLDQKLALF